MNDRKNIVLTGFSGSGKSAAGRLLAEKLSMRFYDTDEEIEAFEKKTITEIFKQHGEQRFRETERKIIGSAPVNNCVIAAGGGAAINPGCMESLSRGGVVVYLETDAETVLKNLAGDATRPLLNAPDKRKAVSELLAEREPFYKKYADATVPVKGLSVGGVVSEIIRRTEKPPFTSADVREVRQ